MSFGGPAIAQFRPGDEGFDSGIERTNSHGLARSKSKGLKWEQTQSAPELPGVLMPARSKTIRRLQKIDDALNDLYAASSQLAADSKHMREQFHDRREHMEQIYHIDSSAQNQRGQASMWPKFNFVDLGPLKAAIRTQVGRQPVALLIPEYKKSRVHMKKRVVELDDEGHFPAIAPHHHHAADRDVASKLLAPTKSFAAKALYAQALARAQSNQAQQEALAAPAPSSKPAGRHLPPAAARGSPSPPRHAAPHFLKPMGARPEVKAF
eukprot:tig00021517_g22000.t1